MGYVLEMPEPLSTEVPQWLCHLQSGSILDDYKKTIFHCADTFRSFCNHSLK